MADARLGPLRSRRQGSSRRSSEAASLAAVCLVLGFAFSTLMDLWLWRGFYPHTWEALVIVLGRGVWFSGAHAAGNVVLALVAGPELKRLLERYARRLKTHVVWA